ncbi:MAG: hypothetical protein LBJ00_10165 [Planctomycetaceae bacterium]|nr:hypothetical protein [Planctomycetaceae bacterium]
MCDGWFYLSRDISPSYCLVDGNFGCSAVLYYGQRQEKLRSRFGMRIAQA